MANGPSPDCATYYRDVIRKAYVERFGDCNDLTDFTHFPNAQFEPPSPVSTQRIWARLTVEASARLQVSACGGGVARRRVIGNMVVQLFSPLNAGERELSDLVSSLLVLFQSVTIDGVLFRTPVDRIVGRSGDWFQWNVVCPFQYDSLS